MEIKTKKKNGMYQVTATEGKGNNRVTVTAVTAQREEAARVAINGCYKLVKTIKETES